MLIGSTDSASRKMVCQAGVEERHGNSDNDSGMCHSTAEGRQEDISLRSNHAPARKTCVLRAELQ